MADSPSHKFGQDLGNLLEDLVLNHILKPRLLEYTRNKNLYLDSQGHRPARGGKLVTWQDGYGNSHNLDFVIELGGSLTVRGRPLAFIEAAWRRYTKHSKNKAQEIQGALLPIVQLHHAPFCGVVLAGEFTKPSLEQLESNGFSVLYIPYAQVVEAFKAINVDIGFDEESPDKKYRDANAKLAAITDADKLRLREALVKICKSQTEKFMAKLNLVLERIIKRVVLIPLFGKAIEYVAIQDAIVGLTTINLSIATGDLSKIEVLVDYSNGDVIRASFNSPSGVKVFLKTLG